MRIHKRCDLAFLFFCILVLTLPPAMRADVTVAGASRERVQTVAAEHAGAAVGGTVRPLPEPDSLLPTAFGSELTASVA